jgi:hypothetical protein
MPMVQDLVRPQLDSILPAAAHSLEIELGRPPGALSVVSAAARSYSSVWELRSASGDYILKWVPLRAERELELTRLSRELFAGIPFVRTPRLACCPTPVTFLVEKLPGEHLHVLSTNPPVWGLSQWVDARCRLLNRVGTWLSVFHRRTLDVRAAPLAGLKAYVLKREAAFPPSQNALLERLLRAIDDGVSAATVRVHGDFTPHNVLVDGDTVAVIDLAGITEFERETPWFDAACMVVGLEETWRRRAKNHLRYFPSAVRQMISAFLQSFDGAVDDASFPLCYAVRHFARIATRFRQTSRQPGARDWHVRRLRLALERPDAIHALARRLRNPDDGGDATGRI